MEAARASRELGPAPSGQSCARSFQGSLVHGVYHRILGTWRTAKAAIRPLALDPPSLKTPPNRGPRTPGLRRKHLKDPLKSPFRQSPFHSHPFLEGPALTTEPYLPLPGGALLSPISWRAPAGPVFSQRVLGGSSASSPRFLSRTEAGPSRSCRGAFRSPRPSSKTGQADGVTEDSLLLDIEKLKEKRELLDKEISQLISDGYSVDELEDHISQLHEYNDIKDVGQMLLGKLAVIRGVTTKELYPEFGLDVND